MNASDDKKAARRLVAQLVDLHGGARVLPAIVSLGDAAVPALESFLRGPSQQLYHMRVRAADALGAIGSNLAIAALIRALRDSVAREPEPLCREAEGVIVGRIADQLDHHRSAAVVEALLDALRARPYPACARLLGEMRDPRAISLLIQCLHEDAARAAAMGALLRFGRAAVAPLRATLATPHVVHELEPPTWIDGRAAAATLLGELGDIRPLISALDDQQRSVRLAAAMALTGCHGALSDHALRVLLQGLDDPDWSRAESIMHELEHVGPRIGRSLESMLEDHAGDEAATRRHRRAAVLAGRLGLQAAAPALGALSCAIDPQLRIAAIDALATIARSDDTHLARFLSDPEIGIAARAIIALNRPGRALNALKIYRWLGCLEPRSSPWSRWWRALRLSATARQVRSANRI